MCFTISHLCLFSVIEHMQLGKALEKINFKNLFLSVRADERVNDLSCAVTLWAAMPDRK